MQATQWYSITAPGFRRLPGFTSTPYTPPRASISSRRFKSKVFLRRRPYFAFTKASWHNARLANYNQITRLKILHNISEVLVLGAAIFYAAPKPTRVSCQCELVQYALRRNQKRQFA